VALAEGWGRRPIRDEGEEKGEGQGGGGIGGWRCKTGRESIAKALGTVEKGESERRCEGIERKKAGREEDKKKKKVIYVEQ